MSQCLAPTHSPVWWEPPNIYRRLSRARSFPKILAVVRGSYSHVLTVASGSCAPLNTATTDQPLFCRNVTKKGPTARKQVPARTKPFSTKLWSEGQTTDLCCVTRANRSADLLWERRKEGGVAILIAIISATGRARGRPGVRKGRGSQMELVWEAAVFKRSTWLWTHRLCAFVQRRQTFCFNHTAWSSA